MSLYWLVQRTWTRTDMHMQGCDVMHTPADNFTLLLLMVGGNEPGNAAMHHRSLQGEEGTPLAG